MSQLLITLNAPIVTGSPITRVAINIERGIPPDAEFAVEATNNANDAIPVWENATASVVGGFNHAFANTQAANGPAFNFRIFAKRGPSGQGGYINNVRYTFWTNTAATLIEIIRAEFGIDDLREQLDDVRERLNLIDDQFVTTPFTIPLDDISGLEITGVWNEALRRIEC